jgi:hypothetical protein
MTTDRWPWWYSAIFFAVAVAVWLWQIHRKKK